MDHLKIENRRIRRRPRPEPPEKIEADGGGGSPKTGRGKSILRVSVVHISEAEGRIASGQNRRCSRRHPIRPSNVSVMCQRLADLDPHV